MSEKQGVEGRRRREPLSERTLFTYKIALYILPDTQKYRRNRKKRRRRKLQRFLVGHIGIEPIRQKCRGIFLLLHVAMAAGGVVVWTISSSWRWALEGRCIVSTHFGSYPFRTGSSRRDFSRLAAIHTEGFPFRCSNLIGISPLCLPIPPMPHTHQSVHIIAKQTISVN